jgi:hypothetical protein
MGIASAPPTANNASKFLAGLLNNGISEGSKFGHCWGLHTGSFQDDKLIELVIFE